ncbi:10510_t:CDS:10 [Acaulospora colombiana]|uniref:10510_t:CDS:1 n=1 Tax=Acaulospora colombiana TaxID=27376 RepID=A0ACA9LX40_9GLOM|nr:10510_t:CDS:10 [Acaulospora colombiana]
MAKSKPPVTLAVGTEQLLALATRHDRAAQAFTAKAHRSHSNPPFNSNSTSFPLPLNLKEFRYVIGRPGFLSFPRSNGLCGTKGRNDAEIPRKTYGTPPATMELLNDGERGELLERGSSSPSLTSPLGPVVDLGYAAYVGNSTSPSGIVNSTVTFFGGIPYVQPPLGNLRFRAPQRLDESVKSNRTVVSAQSWGPTCVQQPAVEGVGVEDCLSLNIWKPSSAKPGDKLPVVVYIHGGGFFFGSSPQFPMYDWVAQSQKVIAVSMNYRLHLFGFLDGTAVRADGAPNAGLLDQRAAIEWVGRHISKFGGNPSQITISGESAGGAAVLLQATAYGGVRNPPFQRAIAQSIGLFPFPLDSEIEGVFRAEAMTCLRAAPLSTLIKSINNVRTNYLAPTIDGPSGFIPDLPSRLITQKKFSRGLDVIAGHVSNDGQNWAGNPANLNSDADIVTTILKRYRHMTNATLTKVLELYPSPNTPGSPFTTQYERMDQWWANATLALGGRDVYSYRFNVPNPITRAANPYMGAMHASDLVPDSGTVPFFAPFNVTEIPVAKEIIGYWTSFTRTGNPSSYKQKYSPTWPNFMGARRVVISEDLNANGTDTASVVETVPVGESARCKWWMTSQNDTRV